jgi:hypothetical protein
MKPPESRQMRSPGRMASRFRMSPGLFISK